MLCDKEQCTGCLSCLDSCPFGAIKAEADSEGFFNPVIDNELCRKCGKCAKSCPILSPVGKRPYTVKAFSAINQDKEALMNSSSGGVFSAIAEYVRDGGGYIAACAFDKHIKAEHILLAPSEDYRIFRGSKYVQSDTVGIYTKVREKLLDGKSVLFVGTPCQVAGLRAYLGKDFEQLLTVDFICHGVSSPKLWKEYLEYLEIEKGKVLSYSFRDKKKLGWGLYYYYYYADKRNGKKKAVAAAESLDPYYHSFLTGLDYREGCYNCCFSNTSRPGDLTMGDLWGVDESKYHEGVSLLLVNSEKGETAIKQVSSRLKIEEYPLALAVRHQHNLNSPTERPQQRSVFYTHIDEIGVRAWVDEYKRGSLYQRARLSYMIPRGVKKAIKKLLRR